MREEPLQSATTVPKGLFMLKNTLLILTLILAASPTRAQEQWALPEQAADTARNLIDTALNSTLGYDVIESLTTEVGPRPAGSKADAVGVAWAQAKLKALGFDKVWVEPVELEGWARGAETARVVAPFEQPLALTTLGGSVATPKKGITAQIIALRSIQDLQEADAKDVKGKIVFLTQKMVRAQDGSGYGSANRNRRLGASEGARKGAVAVLIRSIGTDTHRLPHTGQMADYPSDVTAIPAAAISNPDADLLERILARGEPVKVYLNVSPRSLGGITTYNVIGEILGTTYPEQKVLIGAHLDSWDLGTGAIDDGAGVGIVTAAATLIGRLETRPKRTIRVVLFGAEEVGLIGARAYMTAHQSDLKNHVVAAESDFGARKIWAISPRVHADKVPHFKQIARVLSPLGINYRNNEGRGGPDVGMLISAGVPLTSLSQDGSDYFDLHHTGDDTFDKIDLADIQQNVAAYAAFAYLMAQVDVNWRTSDDPAPIDD